MSIYNAMYQHPQTEQPTTESQSTIANDIIDEGRMRYISIYMSGQSRLSNVPPI